MYILSTYMYVYVYTCIYCVCVYLAVTLFELMVINNWWIIMEGFRNAIGDKPSRPFFICFHLTTAVSYNYMMYEIACLHMIICTYECETINCAIM